MLLPTELFITDYTEFVANLYRGGNASHPRLDHLRPGHDIHVYEKNGVKWVRGDGNGISLFTAFNPEQRNWWKIPAGIAIPPKIRLAQDLRPGHEGHFMLAPESDMLLSEFLVKMDTIRIHCIKVS